MVSNWTEFLSELYFRIFLPLKPENWSVRIDSGIPWISMYERRNFVDDFPPVDLVIFTDGNLEYLSTATSKYIFFLYSLRVDQRNLIELPDPAALAVGEVW